MTARKCLCYNHVRMKQRLKATLSLALTCLACALAGGLDPSLVTAKDLATAIRSHTDGQAFEITATVTFSSRNGSRSFVVEDDSGGVALVEWIHDDQSFPLPGDVIRATGRTATEKQGTVYAKCSTCQVVGHKAPPKPVPADAERLLRGDFDYRLVRLRGFVRDAFRDEIDPGWIYFVLNCNGRIVYCTSLSPQRAAGDLDRLIGADVEIVGVCDPSMSGSRRRSERFVLTNADRGIRVLRPSEPDPFNVPDTEGLRHLRSEEIARLGRHRAAGRVIARWHGDSFLVRTVHGAIFGAVLDTGDLPACDETVEVSGLPESNFYRINLIRAKWRPAPDLPVPESTPEETTARSLYFDETGRRRLRANLDGQLVRISGRIRWVSSNDDENGRLTLESDGLSVPIDTSALPELRESVKTDSEVEISGICLLEVEPWRVSSVFPRIHGISIVVRKAEDLHILSRPSWWTPTRLMSAMGVLLLVLFGILGWLASLQRILRRREVELKAEAIARISSELRVEERTRLAVELHDSIAQSLTGVSLEIDAAKDFDAVDRQKMHRHLGTAARMLKACRKELRDCIWDLRSQALECADMGEAIRRTLAPHLDDVDLVIRFNVPRAKLLDNTTHAILRIIRELTLNAVRHGHAKTIRIAGCLEDDCLRFSVGDDGIGFDPAQAPGIRDGHFGLEGIRERVAKLEGRLTIESEKDRGSHVSVQLHAPHPDDGEKK